MVVFKAHPARRTRMSHPDDFTGLMNWPLYGPRDPEIERLVSQLAQGEGLRLVEIEDLIKDALRQRLATIKNSKARCV